MRLHGQGNYFEWHNGIHIRNILYNIIILLWSLVYISVCNTGIRYTYIVYISKFIRLIAKGTSVAQWELWVSETHEIWQSSPGT